ncbi:MAG: carbohydrate ABC transporter permease [Halobacteriales archaeon]
MSSRNVLPDAISRLLPERFSEGTATDGTVDWTPYIYLFPALALYAVVLVYPFVDTFILSFQEITTLGGEREWVGLANYEAILTDPTFWRAGFNTIIFSVGMVFVPLVLGLVLAILIDTGVSGTSTFRSLIFVPVIVPLVVAGIVFGWILGSNGLLNSLLIGAGLIEEPMRFLNSTTWSLPSVLLMVIWKRTGYYLVILLAGLQGIPDSVYEAAKIAGKSRYETFRNITLPLLKPAILVTVIIGVIDSIKAFAHVWIMTQGGPSHSSEILATYFYKIAFRFFQFGKGAAYGFILFAIALVLSLLIIRLSGGSEI